MEHVNMSNGKVIVTGASEEMLAGAIDLVVATTGVPTQWRDSNEGIVLYWGYTMSQVEGAHKFMAPPTAQEVAALVYRWMKELDYDSYEKLAGPQPDIDGDVDRGAFHLTSLGNHGVIAVIKPAWIERGK